MVIIIQSSGIFLDKLARSIGQTSDLIIHSLSSGCLKFNWMSLFIMTLNMDALKASPVSLRPFVGVYCALHLCRICTLPMLKGFFAFFKKRLCQRSEYVFSLPAFSKFAVWSNCKKSHPVWFFLFSFHWWDLTSWFRV